ncbi:MAG TPA: RecQ family ATP-dependent DNA helicase [Acidimicrobiales bacterium]|nr:RecQ family ATP-dependent DNA helicase [Acidimicrobiales bacterium]
MPAATTVDRAEELLARLTGSPAARFRPGQLEAVTALVDDRQRVLVVQRTGWGKSAVYFVATRLLRDAGAGPTVLVSPLLALMRNQIQMAERAGVHAATINSENRDDWDDIERRVERGEVDVLLISPERLNNVRFRRDVMPRLLGEVGLLVVDEAHCISDWGHDFRPDYRRLARVIDALPAGVPVLCTTATANDRVVADVVDQLGADLRVIRGPLSRESLALSVIDLPQPAERLAWLAREIPRLAGSGIVYCLTVADTERVAGFLRSQGIDAMAYSGGSESLDRLAFEDALLANEIKALVATSALGMGFDKPDLGFVIHYQAPGSPIAYYQQVGRAGRALDSAVGVLLRGNEDADIQDWFIRTAFPPREKAEAILALLADGDGAVSVPEIEREVNSRRSRIEAMLKVLEVEGAVERGERGGWQRTAEPWAYDEQRVERVTALRREEQAAMIGYARTAGCRMAFLRAALDDASDERCGRCDTCTGSVAPGDAVRATLDPEVVAAAAQHLRAARLEVEPRKQWPNGLGSPRGRIPADRLVAPGRALCELGDGGWGSVVRDTLRRGEPLPDEVIAAAARMVVAWAPSPPPAWVAAVPSTRDAVVADAATRLAVALGVPFVDALRRPRAARDRPQREMENSAQQVRNVYGAFSLAGALPPGPVLLVDDTAESRWTLTVVGDLLRGAGCPAVHPFVFALSRGE